jgi:hypothetical protein
VLSVAAATAASALWPVGLLPVLVFLKEISAKDSLDAGVLGIPQGLHLRHAIFTTQVLIGGITENRAGFGLKFHADGFDRVGLYLGKVQIGLHLGQSGFHGLTIGGGISSHSTSLGKGRRGSKERYDKRSASDHFFTKLHS